MTRAVRLWGATWDVRFWAAVLRPFGLEPIERGVTQELVDEIDGLRRTTEAQASRLNGLEQGIHAANETARKFATKARLALTLDGQRCPMTAEVRFRDHHRPVSFAIRCMRVGIHDEHRFEDKGDTEDSVEAAPVLITLRSF